MKLLLDSLPIIGAFGGVWLKHIFDSKGKRESLKHEDIDLYCKQIDDLKDKAQSYWSTDSSEEASSQLNAAQIMGKLHSFEEIINVLTKNTSKRKELRDYLKSFRVACTS